MEAFIKLPKRIPLLIRIGIWISKKVAGKELLVPKLLAWYPKTAVSSGVLESLVAHADKDLDRRILKLVRMQASFIVSCPFCIDMNSFEFDKYNITREELAALQGCVGTDLVSSFSDRERLAIEYMRGVCQNRLL